MEEIVKQSPEHVLNFLKSRNVKRFVHFTSVENLESILENGLLTREELDNEQIDYDWNDPDRLEGRRYINCSITMPNSNLLYSFTKYRYPKKDYVVISINPGILAAHGYRDKWEFRPKNAATRIVPCRVEDLFSGEREDWLKDSMTTNEQAEILFYTRIAPEYFLSIEVNSNLDSSILEKINKIAEIKDLKVVVNDRFWNNRKYNSYDAAVFESL